MYPIFVETVTLLAIGSLMGTVLLYLLDWKERSDDCDQN